MSRSRRRTPMLGNSGARSEKDDKRIANRAFRRITRQKVSAGAEPPWDKDEVSNVSSFNKDGKRWWRPSRPSLMPNWEEYWRKRMRK